jgi:hypothetical protein
MKYRKLGASDLTVSEISLGSWLTYGVGVEQDKARACVDRAFDLGINFIDTANAYGRGAAESFLGEVLASRKRDSYVLATKVFFPMSAADRGLSRAQILKQIDASLSRLKVDYVDLYQCHRYDPDTPLEETMQALSEIVRAGKVRWIGFSEWSPQQIEDSIALKGVEHFVSSQPQYSLLPAHREEGHPDQRGERHLADRVVADRAGGSLRQIFAGRSDPRSHARQQRQDGRLHQVMARDACAGSGAEAEAAGAGSRLHADAVRAGVGAARAERGIRHRRRQQARTARRERGRVRPQDRPGAVRQSGSHRGRCNARELICE